jgi:hypothetical protein
MLRLQPVAVDVPALTELKLDGKVTKLDKLLQLSPWYRPLQQQKEAAQAAAEEAAAAAAAAAGGAGSTGVKGGAPGGKKIARPKEPKVLEFTVKAAAALTGADAPVMPANLLHWATEVRGSWCSEACPVELAPSTPVPLRAEPVETARWHNLAAAPTACCGMPAQHCQAVYWHCSASVRLIAAMTKV